MSCRRITVAMGFWTMLLPPVTSFATPAVSPSYHSQVFIQPDSSTMTLTSGLDVLGWHSTYQMQGEEDARFALSRAVNIRRRDVRQNGTEWTFEEDVMLKGGLPINPLMELRGWVHADLYSDEFQNQMHWVQQGAGVAVTPSQWVEVFPAVGVQEDYRQGQRDRGSLLTSKIDVAPPSWGNGSINWGVEELGNRQNRDFEAAYHVRGDFRPDTFNEFEAAYQQHKRSYYLSAGGEIAERREIHRRIQNQLGYPLGKGHNLRISTSASDSKIEIASGGSRNQHREVETNFRIAVLTSRSFYAGNLLYEWNSQNQEFDEDRINGNHQALRAISTFRLSPVDRLSLNASIVKNRFDTPDTMNFDDRDEWSTRMSLIYSRPINRYLDFSQEMSVYLDHLVYIFSEKSENNYWRRVFRLASTLTSTPFPGVVNRNGFLVASTYRDYDFDREDNPRSDVYRRFTAVDSLELPLKRHINCLLIYQIDLEDRGLLDWSEWIQQISEEYRAQRFQATISYRSPLGWTLSGGWIESVRLGWRYSSTSVNVRTKSLFQNIRTSGPIIACNWSGFDRIEIEVSSQWQWIEDREREDQSLLFADINLRWNF